MIRQNRDVCLSDMLHRKSVHSDLQMNGGSNGRYKKDRPGKTACIHTYVIIYVCLMLK